MKKRFVLLLSALMLLTLGANASFAQIAPECRDVAGAPVPCTPTPEPDTDGDGLVDSIDACPTVPGDRANGGCPAPTAVPPTAPLPDTDGDTFADAVDRCPAESGVGAPGLGDCPDPDGDFITNDGDLCPLEPGPAETGGCPPISAGTTVTPVLASTPLPTLDPSTGSANPLLPPSDGVCQVATATSVPSNVRVEPSLQAQIVSSLQTNQLYAVLSTVVNGEGTWYRVEAGWVSSISVNIGGQCPGRIIAVGPSVLSIPQAAYDEANGGIFPEEECTTLFNGTRFCQIVLNATADDGTTDGSTSGNINVCGTGVGGIQCINLIFRDGPVAECVPEICDPAEPPSEPPFDPSGWPPPGWPNGAPDGSCEALINTLAAQSEAEGLSPYYTVYEPDGSVTFSLRLPPFDPQPCQVTVYVPRPDQAANGLIPVDEITIGIVLPPAPIVPYDALLDLDGVPGESSNDARPGDGGQIDIESWSLGASNPTSGRPIVRVFDGMSVNTIDGVVCIPVSHGDFTSCPDQPTPDPTAPLVLDAVVVDPFDPLVINDLFSTPPDRNDPTEYSCTPVDVFNATEKCGCSGFIDCISMAVNACSSNSAILCKDSGCTCYN